MPRKKKSSKAGAGSTSRVGAAVALVLVGCLVYALVTATSGNQVSVVGVDQKGNPIRVKARGGVHDKLEPADKAELDALINKVVK